MSAAWPCEVAGEMQKWMAEGMTEKLLIPIAVGENSIAFPRRSGKAASIDDSPQCFCPAVSLIPGQPARVHDIQLRIDLPPVSDGSGPCFRQSPCYKIQRLGESHGIGVDLSTGPTVDNTWLCVTPFLYISPKTYCTSSHVMIVFS